ncbi:hypothetical protein PP175_29585 (plasmid) [Aneurinibacillus sp. Ricciae_BoGa-3]|uniref:hypothetical protein n=1 Tax=Aneurinibacillus sp. Ricciae_BoGa-3 TaxID=3022697 RepID=UPI002341E2B7|nr:hypothetical protein [Aneurinibacillus sp. Ricciae_BoGa-3]WCK57345.1 hypothetical protein PP175_29585 [Aneurinibacillus sp. Ricciae_BoGa-3]
MFSIDNDIRLLWVFPQAFFIYSSDFNSIGIHQVGYFPSIISFIMLILCGEALVSGKSFEENLKENGFKRNFTICFSFYLILGMLLASILYRFRVNITDMKPVYECIAFFVLQVVVYIFHFYRMSDNKIDRNDDQGLSQ